MFRMNTNEIVLIVYFACICLIAVYALKATRGVYDYMIGSRRYNAYMTAMGAAASDMSAWLLLGLPGAVYVGGLRTLWLPLGLIVGAYCNWRWVAPRLRVFSEFYDNALTIPNYLSRRFNDSGRYLSRISSFLIIVFFVFYMASGLVAGAYVFQHILPLSYQHALLITAVGMIGYTSFGGYLAINWIDTFQATLIFFALLIVPVLVYHQLHGVHHVMALLHAHRAKGYLNFFNHVPLVVIISWAAWGLGYFGQPHILTRFMSSKSIQTVRQGRRICMFWMVLCLAGAVMIGVVGAAFWMPHALSNPENVFLDLSHVFFKPVLAAILYAAVLSAVMNVISAQLLSAATSLTKDILVVKEKLNVDNKPREMIWLNRMTVILVGVLALVIAHSHTQTVLNLVGFAWACLGATIGPVMLLSLYWRRVSYWGAMAGILVGALVSSLWPLFAHYGGFFHCYAIIPGFGLSLLMTVLVSCLLQSKQDVSLHKRFDLAVLAMRESA